MISYIADYLMKGSNYNVVNIDNIYKFHIMVLNMLNDTEKYKYLDNMKFQLGMTHYTEFKMHLFRKFPNHELLDYFKNI